MDKQKDILKQVDRRTGMTVPDGYFAEFASRMAASLPKEPASTVTLSQDAPRLTTWRRVRPYVYMAAMFAGIWCMMKMFSMIGNTNADLSIDNYPGLATALNNETFIDDYVYPNISDSDIYDHLMDSDISLDELIDEGAFSLEDTESEDIDPYVENEQTN